MIYLLVYIALFLRTVCASSCTTSKRYCNGHQPRSTLNYDPLLLSRGNTASSPQCDLSTLFIPQIYRQCTHNTIWVRDISSNIHGRDEYFQGGRKMPWMGGHATENALNGRPRHQINLLTFLILQSICWLLDFTIYTDTDGHLTTKTF